MYTMFKTGLTLLLSTAVLGSQTLFEFNGATDLSSIQTSDTEISVSKQGLHVRTGADEPWPGITLKASEGHWDFQAFERVAVDLHNLAEHDTTIVCRVDNPGADGTKHCLTRQVTVPAGESQTLTVSLHGGPWALSKPMTLIGMRGCPGQQTTLDPANVTQFVIFVNHPTQTHHFVIKRIQAEGQVTLLNTDTLLPLLDKFGQFRHRSWPGKFSIDQTWAQLKQLEQADRAAHYKAYVQGALKNPLIIGTHWFQYRDQATTGRGDGENYQIGFVDICDTPYPELRKACREVGYGLYETRQGLVQKERR